MIIVLKPHSTEETITRVENMVKNRDSTHIVRGTEMTIIGCIGDTTLIDPRLFEVDSSVDKVMHVQGNLQTCQPRVSSRRLRDRRLRSQNRRRTYGLIAGPCSVESFDQVLEIAKSRKSRRS